MGRLNGSAFPLRESGNWDSCFFPQSCFLIPWEPGAPRESGCSVLCQTPEERRAVSEVFSAMPVNEADSGDPLPHVRYGRTGVTHSFNPSLLSVSDAGGMTFLLLFLGHCLRR